MKKKTNAAEKKPFSVTIVWLPEDIKALNPTWTMAQCEQWLFEHRKCIQDRSIELGWEVINDLL